MTVIAYKDGIMAADKRMLNNYQLRTVTKVRKIDGYLIGISGNADQAACLFCKFLMGSLKDGFIESWPDFQLTDEYCRIIRVTPSGRIQIFDQQPYPIIIEDEFVAIGHGRDYALGAMEMGQHQ